MGRARPIEDPAEKLHAAEAIVEHLVPGRWPDVRPPSENELKATAFLELGIDEASAKVRTGPPLDDEEDYALDVWAGIVPLQSGAAAPLPDPRLRAGITPPPYARGYRRPGAA
jgi:hypothetical protein